MTRFNDLPVLKLLDSESFSNLFLDVAAQKSWPGHEPPCEQRYLHWLGLGGLLPRKPLIHTSGQILLLSHELTASFASPWQSMPQEIIDTHELQTITLDYRRECQHDDVVDSLTSVESINGPESLPGSNGAASATPTKQEDQNRQFLHLLRLSGSGLEINRGRTEWRKKSSRWWWRWCDLFALSCLFSNLVLCFGLVCVLILVLSLNLGFIGIS